jgi:hypothetical protein
LSATVKQILQPFKISDIEKFIQEVRKKESRYEINNHDRAEDNDYNHYNFEYMLLNKDKSKKAVGWDTDPDLDFLQKKRECADASASKRNRNYVSSIQHRHRYNCQRNPQNDNVYVDNLKINDGCSTETMRFPTSASIMYKETNIPVEVANVLSRSENISSSRDQNLCNESHSIIRPDHRTLKLQKNKNYDCKLPIATSQDTNSSYMYKPLTPEVFEKNIFETDSWQNPTPTNQIREDTYKPLYDIDLYKKKRIKDMKRKTDYKCKRSLQSDYDNLENIYT